MSSPSLDGIRWTRIGAEAAAIVLSILLALALDAWWDGVQDRAEEREVLEGLVGEFEAHRGVAQRELELTEMVASGVELLFEARRVLPSASRDSLAIEGLRRVSRAGGATRLRGGVLDALVSSGRLELIENHELRTQLGSWEHIVIGAEAQDQTVSRFVMETLFPAISATGAPLDQVLTPGTDGAVFGPPGEISPMSLDPMLGDPEIFNLLSIRRLWLYGTQLAYQDAEASAERILGLVRAELELR